jgi:cytochrome oxidase assembly protein ShyY1
MLRPQWIAALLLALLVAGTFAWLGQWQLGHAVRIDAEQGPSSEDARPITEVTEAGGPVTDGAAGMVVTLGGELVPGDFRVVEQRSNGDRQGAWVTGHLALDGGEHLAVAIGWAPSPAAAAQALAAMEGDPVIVGAALAAEGRYMPSDGAIAPKPGEDPTRIASMSVAQLVNLWAPFDGPAYGGYLVLHPGDPLDAAALDALGLEAIDSVPPLPVESISWLNLFYAVEWVVFAGFAVYLWYRLARDSWEKEHELRLLTEADGASPAE